MALRLGEHVVAGEIINNKPYSTHGWLALRGEESPLLFELTGDCGGELKGKHLRFETPEDRPPPAGAPPLDRKKIAWHQIGPTGTMRVVAAGGGRDASLPSIACLSLEWFSQNGQVTIELADVEIEWVDDEAEAAAARQRRAAEELEELEKSAAGVSSDQDDPETFDDEIAEDDEPDDPFGLFPPGLDEELAADAGEIPFADDPAEDSDDRSVPHNWRDMPGIDEETAKLYESWDEVVHQEKDVSFTEVFDPPVKLLTAEQLAGVDDAAAEEALRELLKRLALLGVGMSVCEHFTPRMTYRLLVDEILPEHGVHPNLPAIGFVQGYMTSEHCAECEARFEREFEEDERQRGRNQDKPGDELAD